MIVKSFLILSIFFAELQDSRSAENINIRLEFIIYSISNAEVKTKFEPLAAFKT